MTSPVTEKATKKNVWQMPESSKYLQRNLVLDNGHLLIQVLKMPRSTPSSLLTFFSIPNYYIKKGRPHGHRYGKKEGDHEYFIANQLTKKCNKREFLSIHDRFIRDARFRKTMIEMGRTEEVVREMDNWQTRITHTTLLKKK